MLFHRGLSDGNSQFPRSLLRVLADLNNAVVWMDLHSSSYFQVFQSLYQSFGDCTDYYYSFRVFHISVSKSPLVSKTLLRILAFLSNAVIWIISTRPPTSKSSRPFNNPLVLVPKAPITIGTILTFMFHSFFNSLARSRYLSFFSRSFSFILVDWHLVGSSGQD